MPLTTNEIEGLPIVPGYTLGELTHAHMQRIADINYIKISEVSSRLMKFIANKNPNDDPSSVKQALARKLGHPVEFVQTLRLTDYLVVPSNKTSAKRVCPICLIEGMPAQILLLESAYGICHIHRVAHVNRCSECDRRLRWGIGDYFHCLCGFDLRHSPTICVDRESSALYLACLFNQALSSEDFLPDVKCVEKESERLRSCLIYLLQDQGIQSDVAALRQQSSSAVQNEAIEWLAIGMRIGSDMIKLNDVVCGIEGRHIWGPAKPEWMLSRAQCLTDAVAWEPLRFLANDAQRIAIEYQGECVLGSAIHEFDDSVCRVQYQLVGAQSKISSFLSNELLYEIRSQRCSPDLIGPKQPSRLQALIATTRNLRSIDDLRWDVQVPISTKDEVLNFIAAGVIHPTMPLAIEHWHVDQHQVAAAFNDIWQGQWPDVTKIDDDAYVLMFNLIFKPNIKPSEWFRLSLEDIERRVIALMRGDPLSISGFRQSGAQLALPLGFCAFLSADDCQIHCSPNKYQLDSFGFICATWQHAAVALVNACQRAQDHMHRLKGWPKLAAKVAEQYRIYAPYEKSGTSRQIEANLLIARFHPYPYRALGSTLRSELPTPSDFRATKDPDTPGKLGLA